MSKGRPRLQVTLKSLVFSEQVSGRGVGCYVGVWNLQPRHDYADWLGIAKAVWPLVQFLAAGPLIGAGDSQAIRSRQVRCLHRLFPADLCLHWLRRLSGWLDSRCKRTHVSAGLCSYAFRCCSHDLRDRLSNTSTTTADPRSKQSQTRLTWPPPAKSLGEKRVGVKNGSERITKTRLPKPPGNSRFRGVRARSKMPLAAAVSKQKRAASSRLTPIQGKLRRRASCRDSSSR